MKNLFALSALIFFITTSLVGCSGRSHIIVGNTRPAISPSEVKIYIRPPKQFEEIAIIEGSSHSSWAATDQGKTDVAMERLKEEAASLGANGIILNYSGSQYAGSVSSGSATGYGSGSTAYGVGASTATYIKTTKGMAIYVIEE